MNTCNCRECKQAKGAVRLEPKGKRVVRRLWDRPTRATLPPADRVGLRYLLSDTWNVVTSCLRPFWGRLTARHAVGGMGRDDGRSKSHPVMGWIRVITRPARELTSIGCFFARKRAEPILGGKANEATLRVPCALHQMGFGCPCVSQRWLQLQSPGHLYAEVGL